MQFVDEVRVEGLVAEWLAVLFDATELVLFLVVTLQI